MVPTNFSSPTVSSQLSNAAVRPGCGLVFKVDLSAVRAPPIGIVASSLGPIWPVTLSPRWTQRWQVSPPSACSRRRPVRSWFSARPSDIPS